MFLVDVLVAAAIAAWVRPAAASVWMVSLVMGLITLGSPQVRILAATGGRPNVDRFAGTGQNYETRTGQNYETRQR
jgi:hypothetical protein